MLGVVSHTGFRLSPIYKKNASRLRWRATVETQNETQSRETGKYACWTGRMDELMKAIFVSPAAARRLPRGKSWYARWLLAIKRPGDQQSRFVAVSQTDSLTNTKHSLNATSLTYEIFPDLFQLE
jgi:hypothetical protein